MNLETHTASPGSAATIGVLASFWLSTIPFILVPAISSLGEFYAHIPYSQVLLLSTMVPLMVVPFSIISGMVTGTMVRYRTMMLLSAFLILVGGTAPWFFADRFYLVLAARVVCGVGVGLSYPLCNALVIRLFHGRAQGRMQGVSMVVMNLSGMLYQSVSGLVCARDVRYIWLVHGVIAIPLVLMLLFLKEPESAAPASAAEQPAEESFLSLRVVAISFGCCLLYVLVNTVIINVSTVLEFRGLGNSATAGMVASTYAFGGLAAGILYDRVYRMMGRWMAPFCMVLYTAGAAFCAYGGSIAAMIASEVCIGFATYIIWPACSRDFEPMASADRQALANGILSALWNLGVFFSAPYIGLVAACTGDSSPVTAVRVTVWLIAALGVVWTVLRLRRPAKYEIR